MRYFFKKEERLKNKKDFNNIFKYGKCIKYKFYSCYYIKNIENDRSRIGIVVKKKIGNSVKRNYEKRVIKNIYRQNKNILNQNFDIVFILKYPFGTFLDKKNEIIKILSNIQENE